MRFIPAGIDGAWLVDLEPVADERGWFARTFDRAAFADRDLAHDFPVSALSHNTARATLRGMHFQRAPHGEEKLVRCAHGRMFDVGVDLRPASPTYLRWFGVELSAGAGRSVYLPTGVAHGFLTLEEETTVHYSLSAEHVPAAADGVRWDDPAFAISWPEPPAVCSARDRGYADVASRADLR